MVTGIYQEVELSLTENLIPVTVPVKQYDNKARKVRCVLYNNSVEYTVPQNCIVACSGTRPDGTIFHYTSETAPDLATFESASNINPFYDEKTKGFSLKACLDKYRTLADNGMTRLIPGETAGTEVKDANAYDLCTPTHVVINLNHNSSLAEYKANIPDIVKTIKREYPEIIVILMSIDETGTYFPAKYPEYRASEITLGGLHSKNVSIYQYFCDELQDEANGVYVCSGHLIQPAVESYPTLDYVSADSVGRQSGRVLHMAYGRGQYGGPNWHPNNYAHCAWGYQLYALVKYTLALQDMK